MKKYSIIIVLIGLAGFIMSCSKSDSLDLASAPTDGKAGSTARIVIKGDYLYAVDNSSLKVIDITTPENPTFIRNVVIDYGIETIYPFKNYLFIGSNIGMYVYGLTDPTNPQYLSQFQHITACDPVIANDSLAFITLRNNEICNHWTNTKEINVVNIKNILSPTLEMTYYTDTYPYGLDMIGNYLFVCHGADGVVVYDINEMLNFGSGTVVSHIVNIDAYDAIIWKGYLIVIGANGFYKYDFSNIHNIKLVSSMLNNV